MTKLDDLFDPAQLAQRISEKYVKAQYHPTLPLVIHNYTDKTMWDRAWDDVTRTCRGLVSRTDTGEIVARPWRKFFGYGDPAGPVFDLDQPVTVTDKADGSLGILVPVGDGEYEIATRGSFTSEQARHATALYRERYADQWQPPVGVTVLFEIVYPENRVVVGYNGLDDLILLGGVDTETGATIPRATFAEQVGWPGPAITVFPHRSLAEALAADPRPGMEGLVVHFHNDDEHLKLKQADYTAMHALLTRATARVLWRHLAVNACTPVALNDHEYLVRKLRTGPEDIAHVHAAGRNWLATFIEGVPDEFYEWVRTRVRELEDAVADLRGEINAAYSEIIEQAGEDRAAFARLARPHPHFGALFSILDGRETETYLWSAVYPEHEHPFDTRGEDVA